MWNLLMTDCAWNFSKLVLWPMLGLVCLLGWPIHAVEPGSTVIVIYNTRVGESKQVAEYYAKKRQVPAGHLFGFGLPETETMSRREFVEGLQKPLLKKLEASGLFTLAAAPSVSNAGPAALTGRRVVSSTIRYAALCYGVPTKILGDPDLIEPIAAQLRPELRRTEASVDSQLVCLPVSELNLPWTGTIPNPFYGATNGSLLDPTNGLLLVTRLDGPTAAIARGLVDKALEAERDGLWGRAYFDVRGIKEGEYKLGDDMIRGASNVTHTFGFETVMDEKPETFPASFPMSQIAFYAGWYDGNVSGPFSQPQVEFMPGAFAYHLHSFSAQTIRSTTEHWVGPLLSRGATATMGCVNEPYLVTTPDMMVFFTRFILLKFSFAEAAWAAQNSLSWQNIAIGDPLYRPFGRPPAELHKDLESRHNSLAEWSHLMVVNLNLNLDPNPAEAIRYLEGLPITRQSAVLGEKLAELYWAKKRLSDALDTYAEVLKHNPSPQQRIRVLLNYAERRAIYGPDAAALALYQQFLTENPAYPDLLDVYKKLLPLAQRLDKKVEIERCDKEIKRLGALQKPPT
jgi:uncharacterized protein (TIGR03790 family)